MRDSYISPLSSRYASKEMRYFFSQDMKFKTWRRLWVALAESEKELGLNITNEQINQMRNNINNINYEDAEKKEKEIRHDVMSHIYAYGIQCPKAKGIIHLGATSCFVGDNTDLIIIKEALLVIKKKIISTIYSLSKFASKTKDIPTLGFTHLQPAQLTTVGKRACLWIQDLLIDLNNINFVIDNLCFRGVKGTTGTQASFMELFNDDSSKVKQLDLLVSKKMGFDKVFPITGQTYTRKVDSIVLNILSEIAQSAYKFSNDIRLLQNMKEIEEPFEKNQVGSSAMAYKRNPMRCERIGSLCRYIIVDALNPAITASTQWLERTLDDSANKRLSIPGAFLALDGVLDLYINVSNDLVVYPNVISSHVNRELPFMATENILMEAVKRGGDRQELHEKIRKYSMMAAKRVKEQGLNNNLIELISSDKSFSMSQNEILSIIDPNEFVGRAPQQVEEFLKEYINPIIKKNKSILIIDSEIDV